MKELDRRIIALALPTLGALIAEPLFLIVDTALIGHLGAQELAGVGLGQAVLHTVTGLLVFLAYATTPRVARLIGAGRRADAWRVGVDGIWLAAVVGALLLVLIPLAHPLVSLFGGTERVTALGSEYLAISVLGLPAMLIVLAATGLLRGLQDTMTPLIVAAVGFGANAALSAFLIYGAGMGVAGSALGTVIAQWGMAAYYLSVVVRGAGREGASLAPRWGGLLDSARFGGWLLVRNLAMRAALLATTFVATARGTEVLAATQVAFTIFSTLAFALDALAIAAQALVGESLGKADVERTHAIRRRLTQWGVGAGAVVGLALLALSPVLGHVFTSDDAVLALLPAAFVVLALGQPLAGIVFVLDGILIGAGDVRYLGLVAMLNTLVYLPLLALALLPAADVWALATIWAAFSGGYFLMRFATLQLRARSDRWMVTGA